MVEGKPMATLDKEIAIDWTACELIEQVSGKASAGQLCVEPRILPGAVAGSYDLGETIEDPQAGFPTLTLAQTGRLMEFAHAQRRQTRS